MGFEFLHDLFRQSRLLVGGYRRIASALRVLYHFFRFPRPLIFSRTRWASPHRFFGGRAPIFQAKHRGLVCPILPSSNRQSFSGANVHRGLLCVLRTTTPFVSVGVAFSVPRSTTNGKRLHHVGEGFVNTIVRCRNSFHYVFQVSSFYPKRGSVFHFLPTRVISVLFARGPTSDVKGVAFPTTIQSRSGHRAIDGFGYYFVDGKLRPLRGRPRWFRRSYSSADFVFLLLC